jgi:hypothetical protein
METKNEGFPLLTGTENMVSEVVGGEHKLRDSRGKRKWWTWSCHSWGRVKCLITLRVIVGHTVGKERVVNTEFWGYFYRMSELVVACDGRPGVVVIGFRFGKAVCPSALHS